MEIQKIFSEVDTDEMLYSVLMNEDELALFSEIQKEFARRDYEGLDQQAVNDLKAQRSDIAKTLLKKREKINKIGNQNLSDYNLAMDHISKHGYEVPHDDSRINDTLKKIRNSNETIVEKDIRSARESGYKKALASAADDARFEREEALKDTQRRIRQGQEKQRQAEDAARKLEREKRISEYAQKYNKKSPLGNVVDWAGRNKKAIGLTVAGTAVAGGGAYLYNRYKKNKQNNNTIGPTRINASGGETSTLG